jgi:hypothetical protein
MQERAGSATGAGSSSGLNELLNQGPDSFYGAFEDIAWPEFGIPEDDEESWVQRLAGI